jgi:hypothetical protein
LRDGGSIGQALTRGAALCAALGREELLVALVAVIDRLLGLWRRRERAVDEANFGLRARWRDGGKWSWRRGDGDRKSVV